MPSVILVIDDTATLRHLLKHKLEKVEGVEKVLTACDGGEALKILNENHVDLILCDIVMPGLDGFGFLRTKAQLDPTGEVPVIMLTGSEEVEQKVRALESGASDYLIKPFADSELIARIRVHLKLQELKVELRKKNLKLEQLNAELERLSRTDPLTGVANRRHFDTAVELECQRAARYSRPLSLLMLDLDHFKRVNDTRGHQAGDEALVAIATAISCSLRRHDLMGRYGGEEFAILLPETTEPYALVVAERCRKLVESTEIRYGGDVFVVTVSVGVASLKDREDKKRQELIAFADSALYQAKRAGRNRVAVYSR